MPTELSRLDFADWVGVFLVIVLVWLVYALLLGDDRR